MKIGIIGAMTGNGHISVLKALEKEFKDRDIEVDCYPDFYEKLMLSNKILSDFYNFLLSNSIDLCNKYCEFTNATRSDLSEDFYQGVKDNIIDFLLKNNYDILIVAAGTPKLIKKNNVKNQAIIIDVGITIKDNKIYGDVDFDDVKNIVQAISPVPGGVGPLTVICLMKNLIEKLI